MELFDAEANESFTKQVKELIEAFIPNLELLFAKELPKDMRDEIGKKLSKLMLPSLEYARCIEELQETGDMEQFARLSNEFIKKIAPEASSSMSSIGHAREVLFNTSKVEVAYIGKSKYVEYVRCIKEIINVAIGQSLKKVSSYLSTVDNVESDNLAWAQAVVLDMGKTVKYLTPDRKRFKRGLARRCVVEYSKMSGVYERLITMVAGFVSIGSDDLADYDTFRRKGLSKNMEIMKNKGWEILTHDFDVLIRNSIAHKSYVLDPRDRVVHFSDPISGRTESVPYRSLFEKTRDLSCLVLALAQFKGMVYDAILMLISTYINK